MADNVDNVESVQVMVEDEEVTETERAEGTGDGKSDSASPSTAAAAAENGQKKNEAKKKKKSKVTSFFLSRGITKNVGEEPVPKKIKLDGPSKSKASKVTYYCVYKNCLKTISRGNASMPLRHLDSWHKNDPHYCMNKFILEENHKDVIALRKKNVSTKKGKGSLASKKSSIIPEETDENEENEEEIEPIDILSTSIDVDMVPEQMAETGVLNLGYEDDVEVAVVDIENEGDGPDGGKDCEGLAAKTPVQSTIQFSKKTSGVVEENEGKHKELSAEADVGDTTTLNQMVMEKLDFLMEKMSFTSNNPDEGFSEDRNAVSVLKKANNLFEIDGSGISFFPGQSDGLVRCDSCFAMHCDKDPRLGNKDSFFLGHTNTSTSGGNTLALGLTIR